MQQQANERGKWMALVAALLGWLFDGFEMGLFPLVGRPALADLLVLCGLFPSCAVAVLLVRALRRGFDGSIRGLAGSHVARTWH